MPRTDADIAGAVVVVVAGLVVVGAGAAATTTPPLAKTRLVGRFRCSANTVNLSARPSPSVSSQIVIRSLPRLPAWRVLG